MLYQKMLIDGIHDGIHDGIYDSIYLLFTNLYNE